MQPSVVFWPFRDAITQQATELERLKAEYETLSALLDQVYETLQGDHHELGTGADVSDLWSDALDVLDAHYRQEREEG